MGIKSGLTLVGAGGFKRYHQREWDGRHDYEKVVITPLDLNQVKTESYSTFKPEAEKANLSMETIALANNINVANGVNQSMQKLGSVNSYDWCGVSLPSSSLYRTIQRQQIAH